MKYIFANWKMYLNIAESRALASKLAELSFDTKKVDITIFPNSIFILEALELLKNSEIKAGAQNVNWTPQGAYTGAISAFLFKEAGCSHALVGHSERRYIFGDTDDDVRKRLEACLDADLVPVLCIGETQEDREAGKTEYRIKKQIMKAFEDLNLGGKKIFVAYEPVWAISKGGVGEPCEPEEADRMMFLIKEELKQYTQQDIPLIYGGSVKAENVLSYISIDTVQGVLPGHASTKLDNFVELIKAVENL